MLRFLKWCFGSTGVSKEEHSTEQCFPRVWGWRSRTHLLKENGTNHHFLAHATGTSVQHLDAQVWGQGAVMLVINELPTTKEWKIIHQIGKTPGWPSLLVCAEDDLRNQMGVCLFFTRRFQMELGCLRQLQIILPSPLPPPVAVPTTNSLQENTAAAAHPGETH